MEEYAYGYCGMPCALCTRYHTNGSSCCPGCSKNGYYTDNCKVHKCCQTKGNVHCGSCSAFACANTQKMGEFSDLKTDNAKARNCVYIRDHGWEQWYKEYAERAGLLKEALQRYNNGRMKRYLCELFIQKDMETLYAIMREADALCGTPKENGPEFKKIVEQYIH